MSREAQRLLRDRLHLEETRLRDLSLKPPDIYESHEWHRERLKLTFRIADIRADLQFLEASFPDAPGRTAADEARASKRLQPDSAPATPLGPDSGNPIDGRR